MTTFEERFAVAQAEIQAAHRAMDLSHANFDMEFAKAQADIEAAHKEMDKFHNDFDTEFNSVKLEGKSSSTITKNVALADAQARREQLRRRFF